MHEKIDRWHVRSEQLLGSVSSKRSEHEVSTPCCHELKALHLCRCLGGLAEGVIKTGVKNLTSCRECVMARRDRGHFMSLNFSNFAMILDDV